MADGHAEKDAHRAHVFGYALRRQHAHDQHRRQRSCRQPEQRRQQQGQASRNIRIPVLTHLHAKSNERRDSQQQGDDDRQRQAAEQLGTEN